MTDPLSALAKKRKKSELPKPQPVSTHFTKSATTTSTLQKPQRGQAQRVQSPKVKPVVKPVRPKIKQQAPAYRNEDFQFATNVDNLGVNILVMFQGTQIYTFLLPATEYELWQRMRNWSQRYEYVKMKIPPTAFMGDTKLINSVVKTILNILDTLFAKAQAIQAQAQQQQRTHVQKRRV